MALVDRTPHELRQQAEHCRQLASSQVDERVRLTLRTMATEYDEQAVASEAAELPAK